MRILITAGPTREFFDTVRFLSNPSTGKMGYALATAAAARGHEVVLISGPVSVKPPTNVETITVVTAAEMAAASKRAFRRADAAILTAAVCDYRPRNRARRKLKKQARPCVVTLEPTEDISATLGRTKGRRITIAFAMEDHDHRQHAADKLARKRCDAIVLNGPENIGADRASVQVLIAGARWVGPWRGTKKQIAKRIVRLAERLRERQRTEREASKPQRGGRRKS